MPSTIEILDALSAIANQAKGIAVAWHIVIGMALIALAGGWRPSRRTARLLAGSPLVSVAAVAFAFGNPFNGWVFTAGALALTALAMNGDLRPVWRESAWAYRIGVATIAFGWSYPHFLEREGAAYLYASPAGLIPCPTLAVAIGFALLGNGLGSRVWALTLAGVGLFYGLLGVMRLGVFLDIGLIAGAVALAASALRFPAPGRAWHHSRPVLATDPGQALGAPGADKLPTVDAADLQVDALTDSRASKRRGSARRPTRAERLEP
jgi:hypothetical protein